MPVYFSVPLPGPFHYSKRVGGRRRRRSRSSDSALPTNPLTLFCWLIGAAAVGVFYLAIYAVRGMRVAYRWLRHR